MPVIRQDSILMRLIKDVNDIRSSLRRVTVNLPLFDIANENTPATLTEDQNDYVIGNYDVLRLQGNQAITITGLNRGVKGRVLRIFNVGGDEIVLAHQSSLSTAEYRIISPTGRNAVINAGGEIVLYYDATSERWRTSYNSNADRISVDLRLSADQSVADATYVDISWDTALVDTGNFFDADNPTYVTVPETGWYQVACHVSWLANANGFREMHTSKSSLVVSGPIAGERRGAVVGGATSAELVRLEQLAAGEKVYVTVWQNSGAPLDIVQNAGKGTQTGLYVTKM